MRRFAILIILLFLAYSTSVYAQAQKVKINSITVEGNKSADAGMIRLNSGLTPGVEISGEDLQQAVKNLWSLQIFSDIKIYVINQTVEGLDLLIKVKEYPRLNNVVISGNDELSKKDVEEEIDTYRSMIVSQNKIFKMSNHSINFSSQ